MVRCMSKRSMVSFGVYEAYVYTTGKVFVKVRMGGSLRRQCY